MPHAYGRLYIPDDRDRAFPLRAAVPEAPPDRRWCYWWASGWWGDQGTRPWCVAYAWLHWLEDGPRTVAPYTPGAGPIEDPRSLYCEAQTLDPWPGDCANPRYDGTSVRAGAKALQRRGWIGEYRWAWDLPTLLDAVLTTGPVVVGTWWYSGMDEPDDEGFVWASGSPRGGHAYLINGANLNRGIARLKNSWGRSWGRNGSAWIDLADLERLLHEEGEACMALPPGA